VARKLLDLEGKSASYARRSPGLVHRAAELITAPFPPPQTKAIIDFSGYEAPELGPVATTIHTKMLAAATTFDDPPLTTVAFLALITDASAKLVARGSGASADRIAFDVARDEFEAALTQLGNYVNSVAKGDPVIVELSGFPSYQTGSVPDYSPPGAPGNLRLRHGEVSGAIIIRYKPVRTPSMNEVYTCTGDPNVEANWHDAGTFSGGKATLAGLTPGATLRVRVRTAGLKGVMGAWSDPAKIMVV
jgi:hypothetical protein